MLVPLVKINITAAKDARERILDFLQEKGIMEISDIMDTAETGKGEARVKNSENAGYHASRIDAVTKFLAKYDNTVKTFKKKLETVLNPDITLSKKELEKIITTFNYKEAVNQTLEIQKNINLHENIINESKNSLDEILEWRNLNFIPEDRKTLKNVKILLGTFPNSIFLAQKHKSVQEINQNSLDLYR